MFKEGELYSLCSLVEVILMPFDLFLKDKVDNYIEYKSLIELNSESEPNTFMFLEYVYDEYQTKYSKVLYQKNIYIMKAPYHISDYIKKC